MDICGDCVSALNLCNHIEVSDWCTAHGISLVVVGPEGPLADGIADSLTGAGYSSANAFKKSFAVGIFSLDLRVRKYSMNSNYISSYVIFLPQVLIALGHRLLPLELKAARSSQRIS